MFGKEDSSECSREIAQQWVVGKNSFVLAIFFHFNVKLSDINYIHNVVQPSPLSIFFKCISLPRKTLSLLSNNAHFSLSIALATTTFCLYGLSVLGILCKMLFHGWIIFH